MTTQVVQDGYMPTGPAALPTRVSLATNTTNVNVDVKGERWSGNGYFAGQVTQNAAAIANAFVQCWHTATGLMVKQVTCDSFGYYTIPGLDTTQVYDVIAVDPAGYWEKRVSSGRYPATAVTPIQGKFTGIYVIFLDIVGSSYSPGTVSATGGSGTGYSFSLISPPSNWSINSSSGVISSTSIVTGIVTLKVQIVDSAANVGTLLVSFQVANSMVAGFHFNGTNGSTTITDVMGGSWTCSGDTQISTAQSKFGGASLSSAAAGLVQGPGFAIPAGMDFTIQGWIYPVTLTGGGGLSTTLLDMRPASTNGPYITLAIHTAGDPFLAVNGTSQISTPTGTISAGLWTHFAVTRSGTNTRMFVNGTQVGIWTSDTTDYSQSGQTVFGRNAFVTTNDFNGYWDDWQIIIGSARWTSNFTPPASAFTY